MPSACREVFFLDRAFKVWENVYEPAEDSFLFAENLVVPRDACAIDIGTGCGILAILVAEKAKSVLASDVNPHALRCAEENARLNDVKDKFELVRGDLFTPIRIGKRFDLITFNAPYLPSDDIEDDSWLARAWTGGVAGRQVIDHFIFQAPKHLQRHGCILMMQSTLSDISATLLKFRAGGLQANVVARKALPFFEEVVLIKAGYQD